MDPSVLATAIGAASGIFTSGVFFSSSQMVVPLLYKHTSHVQTDIFAGFFWRGFAVVAPGALASATAFGVAAYLQPEKRVELGAAAALALAPLAWTRLAMQSDIDKLLKCQDSKVEQEKLGDKEILRLLKGWKTRNWVRAGTIGAGGVLGLWILLHSS